MCAYTVLMYLCSYTHYVKVEVVPSISFPIVNKSCCKVVCTDRLHFHYFLPRSKTKSCRRFPFRFSFPLPVWWNLCMYIHMSRIFKDNELVRPLNLQLHHSQIQLIFTLTLEFKSQYSWIGSLLSKDSLRARSSFFELYN